MDAESPGQGHPRVRQGGTNRRGAGYVLAALGLGLLGLEVGARTLPRPTPDPAGGSTGVRDFDGASEPADSLAALDARAGPGLAAVVASVDRALAHGPAEPLTWRDDWLLYAAGAFVPELRATQRPERVLRGARGLCHDAVAVLLAVVRRRGQQGRMVDLEGHVVAEVDWEGERWLADPDFGFVLAGGLAALGTTEGRALAMAELEARGHARGRIEAYAAVLARGRAAVVAGDSLSPRLARIEDASARLRWLVPLGCLGLAARWGLRRRPADPSRAPV